MISILSKVEQKYYQFILGNWLLCDYMLLEYKRFLISLIQWCITASIEWSFSLLSNQLEASTIFPGHTDCFLTFFPALIIFALFKIHSWKNTNKSEQKQWKGMLVFSNVRFFQPVYLRFFLSERATKRVAKPWKWAAKPVQFSHGYAAHFHGYISSTWTKQRVKQFSCNLRNVVESWKCQVSCLKDRGEIPSVIIAFDKLHSTSFLSTQVYEIAVWNILLDGSPWWSSIPTKARGNTVKISFSHVHLRSTGTTLS